MRTHRFEGHGRKWCASALTASLLAISGSIFVTSSSAEAYIGETKTLPTFYGTGSISYTRTWGGTARWDLQSGSYCLYVQYKHVAVLGVDGTWNRLTNDDCGGTAKTASFYKSTSRAFNGMKFRLCQNKPYDNDPCGSSVTIYN